MTKTPAVRRMLAGFLLLLGGVTQAHAQAKYSPNDMLDPRLAPKQDDVAISTPTPEELKSCTVASVQGSTAGSGGFVLMDANKKPLRRFFDSKGGGKVDVWSYFKDGVEVYREFDTAYKGTPNNFRWLNSAGMKWGVGGVDPKTGKAYITTWRMISAEEVGAEAYQAVARQDYARLQALFITENEMQLIKLSATQVKRIAEIQQQAQKKFSNLTRSVNLSGAKFEVVEGGAPMCDNAGDVETIKYPTRAVRYEINKKHDWIHTGEMIQVGMAWRLVDAPSDKDPNGGNQDITKPQSPLNPELENHLKILAELDLKQPPQAGILSKDATVDAYYRKRINLVQQIIPLDKADQREGWYKQLFDNLTALAQNGGDQATVGLLKQMADDVISKMPGSNLAGYGVYREAWTRYAIGMAKSKETKEINAHQDKWLDDLSEFVKKYSKADDTAEALHQLAIGCEFAGKTEEAKRWYIQLSDGFPQHHLAPRSRGSVARLSLVGNAMTLTAPLLDGGKTFDIAQLKGKIVLVHYWGSYSDQYIDDFARLKGKLQALGTKLNVELVSINLDDDAAKARAAIAKTQAPGIHLYQAPSNNSGGLSGPLATQYGIHVLPTLFMVNREGRVTSNSLQIGDIDTELRKVQ